MERPTWSLDACGHVVSNQKVFSTSAGFLSDGKLAISLGGAVLSFLWGVVEGLPDPVVLKEIECC